eukprot:2234331-Pyramimonas_sp.AAC.1
MERVYRQRANRVARERHAKQRTSMIYRIDLRPICISSPPECDIEWQFLCVYSTNIGQLN